MIKAWTNIEWIGVFRFCKVKLRDKPPQQYRHSPWQPLDWASAVDTPTSPQTGVYWSTLQTALDSSTGQSAMGESSDTATGEVPAKSKKGLFWKYKDEKSMYLSFSIIHNILLIKEIYILSLLSILSLRIKLHVFWVVCLCCTISSANLEDCFS